MTSIWSEYGLMIDISMNEISLSEFFFHQFCLEVTLLADHFCNINNIERYDQRNVTHTHTETHTYLYVYTYMFA